MRGLQLRVEIADASVRESFRLMYRFVDVDGVCVSRADAQRPLRFTQQLSFTIPEPAAEYNGIRTRAGSSVEIKSAMDLDSNKEE